MKKIARHSFKEFCCELQILTDNCLHMNIPYLAMAYSQNSAEEESMRMAIAKRLVHLVAGYDRILTVRLLYDRDSSNRVTERVVEQGAK